SSASLTRPVITPPWARASGAGTRASARSNAAAQVAAPERRPDTAGSDCDRRERLKSRPRSRGAVAHGDPAHTMGDRPSRRRSNDDAGDTDGGAEPFAHDDAALGHVMKPLVLLEVVADGRALADADVLVQDRPADGGPGPDLAIVEND